MNANEGYSISAITALVLAAVVIAAITGTVFSPENSIAILGFAAVICTSLLTLLKVENAEAKSSIERAEIHTLVDSNMDVQLQTSAVALRRAAELSGDPADMKAAELAEAALKERKAKQTVVAEVKSILKPGGEAK